MKIISLLFFLCASAFATNNCLMLSGPGGVTCTGNLQFDTTSNLLSVAGPSYLNSFSAITSGDALVSGLLNNSSTQAAGVFLDYNTNAGGAAVIRLLRGRGTQASPSAVTSGDSVATISMGGYDSSIYKNTANIVSSATENWDASHHGTQTIFNEVATGSNNATSRLGFTGDGFLTFYTKFLCTTDGTCDIGAAGSQRVGSIYVKNNVVDSGYIGYFDGTNTYVTSPSVPTAVTCATTATVDFNAKLSATVPLTLTAADTCVLTLAGLVVGGSYILHISNQAGAVLTLPGSVDFGGATYIPSSSFDNIGLFVVDATPHINGSVIGTGYAN